MRIGIMLRTIDDRQGIGVYVSNLMDHLLPLDAKNEYVLFYKDAKSSRRYAERYPNVTEVVLPAPHKALWDQVVIPLAARRHKLDVIFHPKFTLPFFTTRKTVMTIHGASWFVHPELYPKLGIAYIRAFMPLYCRKADLILSNSDLTTDDFVRILHVPREKIRTIELGTNSQYKPIDDQAALARIKQQYQLPDKFILSVIRHDPRKNFENLIAAFRLLRKKTACKLVVTGLGCEKYRAEYALDEDGTAADVVFTGWVEQTDLPCMYSLARCMFFPSVYEEFGIPACEAMACGCPPVVSKTGALPGIVRDAGLIVDQFAPPEMAAALYRIYTDDALRAELATRSLARSRDFTWERCARQTLDAINGLGCA